MQYLYCYSFLFPSPIPPKKVKMRYLAWLSLEYHHREVRKKFPIILDSIHKLCSQINFSNYKETMDFKFLSPLCNRNIFLQGWPCRAQKQQENESKRRPQMGNRMRNNAIVIIPKSRKPLSPNWDSCLLSLQLYWSITDRHKTTCI